MVNGNGNHVKTGNSKKEPIREEPEPSTTGGGQSSPSTANAGSSKIGLAWKRLNSTPDEEDASLDRGMFSNTRKLIQSRSRSYVPPETSEAWTQTEPLEAAVQTCCCECHKKKNGL